MSGCTEQSFLKDVASHEMTVLSDDGVRRHIRFRRPDSGTYRFDLITWPGALCYTGDMGTYVFSRLEDMFQFFRTDRREGGALGINPGYWSEKLVAVNSHGRHGGSAVEFDEDRFRDVINQYRVEWIRDSRDTLTKDERRELWEAVDDEVLSMIHEGESAAQQAAYGFSHGGFQFEDLFEFNLTRFTYHFIWCCYALAWGVGKYDEAKGGEA